MWEAISRAYLGPRAKACVLQLQVGVCKKLRDLLDAMLLLGNTLMIQKNTTRSRYVILGLVKVEPDMSYDTQVRLSKTRTRFVVTKCVRVMEKQNAHAFWRTTKNGFTAWLEK